MTTTFTTALIVMNICTMAILIIQKATSPSNEFNDNAVQNAIMLALAGTYEICYIKYSFARSSHIFEMVMPRIAPAMKVSTKISPIVMYVQVVPAILMAANVRSDLLLSIYFVLPYVSGIYTIFFDLGNLLVFAIYIQTTKMDSQSIDPRFRLISQFGCVSSSTCILAVVIMLIPTENVFWFRNKSIIAIALLLLVMCILFAMKVALYLNAMREEKRVKLNQERAKQIAQVKAEL
ncbi:UNVERIFIED_CONTAM: hypothetical protein HDU68_002319 [Siphonaria sp. JEL0065]|nr:hypothetical protein HDU68_002319 [Siphonaria sp. JEL0065]